MLVVPGEFFLLDGVGVLSLEFPAEWTVDNEELRPSVFVFPFSEPNSSILPDVDLPRLRDLGVLQGNLLKSIDNKIVEI